MWFNNEFQLAATMFHKIYYMNNVCKRKAKMSPMGKAEVSLFFKSSLEDFEHGLGNDERKRTKSS